MFNKRLIKKGFTLVELVVAMTVSTIVLAGVSGLLIFFNSFFDKVTIENRALNDSLSIKKNMISFFDEVVIKETLNTNLNNTNEINKPFFAFKDLTNKEITLINNKEKKIIEASFIGNQNKIISTYSSELEITFKKVDIQDGNITKTYNNFVISRELSSGAIAEVINFSYYQN